VEDVIPVPTYVSCRQSINFDALQYKVRVQTSERCRDGREALVKEELYAGCLKAVSNAGDSRLRSVC